MLFGEKIKRMWKRRYITIFDGTVWHWKRYHFQVVVTWESSVACDVPGSSNLVEPGKSHIKVTGSPDGESTEALSRIACITKQLSQHGPNSFKWSSNMEGSNCSDLGEPCSSHVVSRSSNLGVSSSLALAREGWGLPTGEAWTSQRAPSDIHSYIYITVIRICIRIQLVCGSRFDPDWESGSRKKNMTRKKEKKLKNYVLECWMFTLKDWSSWTEGFCSFLMSFKEA